MRVRREGDTWIVSWGEGEARNKLLDLALIEAARIEREVVAHSSVEYGRWIRMQADRIERDLRSDPEPWPQA